MRFLLLGPATDDPAHAEPAGTCFVALQEALAQHTGEPIEARFAFAFPLPTLAGHVRRRLETFAPGIVVLHCAGYPIASVTIGAWLASVLGGRAYPLLNGMRQLAHRAFGIKPYTIEAQVRLAGRRQRYYLAVRDALTRAGLGQTITDVETAAASYEQAIRELVAHEHLIIVVRGPLWNEQRVTEPARASRSYRAAMQRVATLDNALATTCARLRIPYDRVLGTDCETATAEGQIREAQREFEILRPLLSE